MMKAVKAFFLFVLTWLADHAMRPSFKRGIFLAMLDEHLQQSGFLNRRPLERTNEVMKMATQVDALLLPAYLYQRLWGQETFLRTLKLSDWDGRAHDFCREADMAERLSASIFDMIPAWLRYGSRETILSDIRSLLTCPVPHSQTLAGAA